ncbi:cytochrome P450 [Mycena floridula]|nr:cytochrome P450 [Mycena floridula]
MASLPEVFLVGFALYLVFLRLQKRHARFLANPKSLPTPPGPKKLPFVGNLLDLPKDKEAAAYFKMAQDYGDLVYLEVFGRGILVVNSSQAANDLFEKRSVNYSDRNDLPMINGLMGWDWSFGHMRYGERWKNHRRMFHKQFQASNVSMFLPIQLKEAHKLLRRLLKEPNDLINHLRFNSGSIIMNVTYGIEIADCDDSYIIVAEKALDGMAKASVPGAFLVDLFPALTYVPDWMPLASFKRKAREWKKAVMEMRDAPFNTVLQSLQKGTASPSFVSSLMGNIESEKHDQTYQDTVRNCAGLAYAAGTESIVSALSSFFLAMILYPEIQDKARRELSSVARGRLPDFTDRGSLPYIDALVLEVFRWNPVAPLGLPHMATADDEYNGYHISAGTMVLGNSWTILHDPATYPDPQRFNPDRFLVSAPGREAAVDHLSVAFGYGRRICPGRLMAEASLWISIACILVVYDIGPGLDELGRVVKPVPAFSSGMICHPLPFEYTVTPRGEEERILIEQTADLAP